MIKYISTLILGLLVLSTVQSQELRGKKLIKESNTLIEAGDEVGAIHLLNANFSKEDKNIEQVSFQLANLLFKNQSLDSANMYLAIVEEKQKPKYKEEVVALRKLIDSKRQEYKIEASLGWKAFDAGDFTQAKELFTGAIKLDNGNYEAYLGLAEMQLLEDHQKESVKGFKKALTKYFPTVKEKAHAYEHLAEAYFAMGLYLKTIETCESGLELEEDNKELTYYKGLGYYSQRQYEKSQNTFTEYVRLSPMGAKGWYFQGMSMYQLQNFTNAEESLSQCLKNDSAYLEAYFGRGMAYFQLKEYDKGRADFNAFNTLSLNNFPGLNAQGICSYYGGKYPEAVQLFEASVALNPTRNYKYNLLMAYAKNEQYDKALQLCDEFGKESRGHVKFNLIHCEVLMSMGKYEEAASWLEGSMAINTFVIEYLDLSKEIYNKLGNKALSKDAESKSNSLTGNPINRSLLF